MSRPGGYVYILTNKVGGTLYVGVTSDLVARVYQHRSGFVDGFTKKYGLDRLVYFEVHGGIEAAILREKQIKKWNRTWKIRQIEEQNPHWLDLYPQIAAS
jgi:putative endonuclease